MTPSSAGWTAAAMVVAGLLGGFFTWLTQRTKGKVEETVAVRGEWAKLTDGLSRRLTEVESAFAKHKIDTAAEIAQMKKDHAAEIAQLRLDHANEIAEMKRNHAAEMKAMRDLNEGLQKMIAQNSQSSAQMLSDVARGRRHGTGVARSYGEEDGEG